MANDLVICLKSMEQQLKSQEEHLLAIFDIVRRLLARSTADFKNRGHTLPSASSSSSYVRSPLTLRSPRPLGDSNISLGNMSSSLNSGLNSGLSSNRTSQNLDLLAGSMDMFSSLLPQQQQQQQFQQQALQQQALQQQALQLQVHQLQNKLQQQEQELSLEKNKKRKPEESKTQQTRQVATFSKWNRSGDHSDTGSASDSDGRESRSKRVQNKTSTSSSTSTSSEITGDDSSETESSSSHNKKRLDLLHKKNDEDV